MLRPTDRKPRDTIISKYFKENFSITESSVDEVKNIFVLERNKKGRRTHKLMRTDQNLPRLYFHYVVHVVYNSLYFFYLTAHKTVLSISFFNFTAIFSFQTSPQLVVVTLTKINHGLDKS